MSQGEGGGGILETLIRREAKESFYSICLGIIYLPVPIDQCSRRNNQVLDSA